MFFVTSAKMTFTQFPFEHKPPTNKHQTSHTTRASNLSKSEDSEKTNHNSLNQKINEPQRKNKNKEKKIKSFINYLKN